MENAENNERTVRSEAVRVTGKVAYEELRRRVKECGQNKTALQLGVSPQVLSNWLTGKREMPSGILLALCWLVDIPVSTVSGVLVTTGIVQSFVVR